MNINIAILEDTDYDFNLLCSCLKIWSTQAGHTIHIQRYKDEIIIEHFKEKKYDLLFADMDLKHSCQLNGLNLCKKLRDNGYTQEIIILTAFQDYVFDGYNISAFNYLMKPVTMPTLTLCLQRFVETNERKYYCLHDRSLLLQIKYNDILYIEKEGRNLLFHTNTEDYYEKASLTNILTKLPKYFIQCHKSCIVNLNHVVSIKGFELLLSDQSTQHIGRNYLSNIRNAILDLAST